MKKIKVISEFVDKYDLSHHFYVGMEGTFDDERAASLVERGLGVYVEEKQQELFKEEVKAPEVKPEEPREEPKEEAPKAEPEEPKKPAKK